MYKNLSFLILVFFLIFSNLAVCQAEDYDLYISTIEAVDRNSDGQKDGIEIFYILKKGRENITFNPHGLSCLEAYLYEDRKEEALISFWRIEDPKELTSKPSIIYLPFRQGFAYNIYANKIIPAFFKIKLVFNDGKEAHACFKDNLSFLAY